MSAGKLNRRVEIQEQSWNKNSVNGKRDETWTTVATVWGQVLPLSAQEVIAAAKVWEKVNFNVKIRYRRGVTNRNRLRIGGTTYQVHGVIDENDEREFLILACSVVS